MKITVIRFAAAAASFLFLTGCYTSFKTVTPEPTEPQEGIPQAGYIENGWYEISGAYFYIDYSTRLWYSYHGIDLATDKHFLRMAHFRYHHPTSTYYYSPFSSFFFYNYPGYSNSYFYRGELSVGNARIYPGAYHPPYYSNQYMYSFYYNRWAQRYYWDSAFPNDDPSPYYSSAGISPLTHLRSTGLSNNEHGKNLRTRNDSVSRVLDGNRSASLNELVYRDRIRIPRIEPVQTGRNHRSMTDRWTEQYRQRLDSMREARQMYRELGMNNSSDSRGIRSSDQSGTRSSSVNGRSSRDRSSSSGSSRNNNGTSSRGN